MARHHILTLGCLLASLLFSRLGSAQPSGGTLEEALAAYEEGQLNGALELFEEALLAPGHEVSELVTIHLYLGMLHAAMGEEPLARRSFEVCLALDPTHAGSDEFGPQLRQLFDEVRDAREGRALSIEIRRLSESGTNRGGVDVEIAALNAPEGLVAALELDAESSGEAAELTMRVESAGPTVVTLPASLVESGTVRLEVVAHDANGSVLARGREELHPSPAAMTEEAEEADDDAELDDETSTRDQGETRRQRRRRALWIGLGVGLGTLVAGAVVLGATLGTAEDVYNFGPPQYQ